MVSGLTSAAFRAARFVGGKLSTLPGKVTRGLTNMGFSRGAARAAMREVRQAGKTLPALPKKYQPQMGPLRRGLMIGGSAAVFTGGFAAGAPFGIVDAAVWNDKKRGMNPEHLGASGGLTLALNKTRHGR